jgi:iron(III) transport system substrate-binding protein
MMTGPQRHFSSGLIFFLLMNLLACAPQNQARQVVIYTSVDQVYAEPVLKRFTIETGILVKPVYDVEATKTTGLVNRLIAEKERPLADVFWSGEFVQTLLLQDKGILQAYRSPSATDIPALYKDPDGYWTGFAGRMRVLLVNKNKVNHDQMPASVDDLLDPAIPGQQVGMAQPLFGTTLTHAAAVYAGRGPQQGRAFFQALKSRGIQVVDGNSVVRDMVADGALGVGLLDSDDACVALQKGAPVKIIIPDQSPAQTGGTTLGTLIIPSTLGVVAGAPHLTEARLLVDFLLRPETEQALVNAGWSHVPLHPGLKASGCFKGVRVIGMTIPLRDIYAQLAAAQKDLTEIYIQ